MSKKEYSKRARRNRSSNSSLFRLAKKNHNPVKIGSKWVDRIVNKVKNAWRLRRKWKYLALVILGMAVFSGLDLTLLSPPVTAQISSTASVNNSFADIEINPGATTQLTISFFNTDPNNAITNGRITDNLQGDTSSGLVIANPPGVTFSPVCGTPTVNNNLGNPIAPGDTFIDISNVTIPAATTGTTRCDVTINVTSTNPGNNINNIPANAFTNTQNQTNLNEANATLTVLDKPAPTLTKNFAPNTILTGGVSTLSIAIRNNADIPLTNVNLTDTLPTNVTATNPATGTVNTVTQNGNCLNGTIGNNANSITLSGVTIAAGATCQVRVDVTSAIANRYTNNIPVNSITNQQGLTNTSPASDNLNVQELQRPTVTKSFRNDPVIPGANARLRIDIRNNSAAVPITGVSLTDVLPNTPNQVFVTNNPNLNVNGNCQGGSITANPGNTAIVVSNITIPTNRNCRIEVNVTANFNGSYTNTIGPGDVTVTGPGITSNTNTTTDPLVIEGLTGTKTFSPTPINPGQISTINITLRNFTDTALTGVNFVDNLPGGVQITNPTAAATTCVGGTISANPSGPLTAGATSFRFTGGTIPARTDTQISPTTPIGNGNFGSCTITVQVVGNAVNITRNNDLNAGTIGSDQGITNARRIRGTLRVGSNGFNLVKFFVNPNNTDSISVFDAGSPFRVRLRIQLPINIPQPTLTDVTFSDTLPAGLEVANPPNIDFSDNACRSDRGQPKLVTATARSNTINVSGIDLNRATQTNNDSNTCDIFVNVVGAVQGTYTNDIAAMAANTTEGFMNLAATSATINLAGVNIAKNFTPESIAQGGRSVLRVSIINNETSFIEGATLTDNLTLGSGPAIVIADPPNASTTCGAGTVTATPGGSSFRLNNGTVPPRQGNVPGLCTFQVNVTTAGGNGNKVNEIPANSIISSNGRGSNITPASATLGIGPLAVNVNQFFTPNQVANGATSVLTVRLTNPGSNGGNVTLLDTSFTANFDPGLIIASPANTATTCTNGVVNAVPGAGSFSFSGGEIPPESTCQVTLEVISTRQGNQTSTIAAGGVTTFQGATNTNASPVSITNLGVQGGASGVSVGKAFAPEIIAPGGTSRLTITIFNISSTTLTNLSLSDTFPAGVTSAVNANRSTTCGGAVTSTANSISLANGTLAGGSTCTISVNVTANNLGQFDNQIPANAINNNQNRSNADPATATLTVTTAPTVAKSFSPGRIMANQNSTLTIALGNNAGNPITLTTSLVDNFPDGLVVANPVNLTGTTCQTNNIQATPGGTRVTYAAGATIPAAGCNIVIEVTGVSMGTKANNIPVGALNTSAGQNSAPAAANLIVGGGPELLLVKRITAINGTAVTSNGNPLNIFVNDPNDPNDTNPGWPSDFVIGGIDGGEVQPGDTIEYTTYFLSNGTAPARNVRICDVIPAGLSFIADAFNGSSPRDTGSLGSGDLGIALRLDTTNFTLPITAPTVFITNLPNDDRAQFFSPGFQLPSACRNPIDFLHPATAAENVSGAVVVDVVRGPDPAAELPPSTGPGTPLNSFGFVRFRVRFD